MKVGLIGGGYWGSKHLRVCAGLSEIDELYLAELNPKRRNTLIEAFPTVQPVDSVEEMLDRVDAVIIATKPETHAPLGRQVLSAGKHCLIEKPLTTSLAEALELDQLARDNDVVLMTGHTFEFNPVVDELKARIQSKELGKIHYIRSLRLNLGLYQPDINVIWDLAPHDASIINFILDDSPTEVSTWASRMGSDGTEDVAMLRLLYERAGVEAFVHVSWLDPSKTREITIVGDNKMAVYDDVRSQEQLRIFDRGLVYEAEPGYERPMSYRYGDITSPFIALEEPLMIEDRSFIEAAHKGHAVKANSMSAIRVVATMEAAQRSLEEGRPVRLSEIFDDTDHDIDLDQLELNGGTIPELSTPITAAGG